MQPWKDKANFTLVQAKIFPHPHAHARLSSLSLAGAESGVVLGRPLGAGAQGEEDAREEAPRNGGGTQGEKERMLLAKELNKKSYYEDSLGWQKVPSHQKGREL